MSLKLEVGAILNSYGPSFGPQICDKNLTKKYNCYILLCCWLYLHATNTVNWSIRVDDDNDDDNNNNNNNKR